MSKGTSTASKKTAVNRRRVLKSGLKAAVGGAGLAMGPWIVRDARSSSGSLSILMLSQHLPDNVVAGFTKKTGIKVKRETVGSNAELQVILKSTRAGPSADSAKR